MKEAPPHFFTFHWFHRRTASLVVCSFSTTSHLHFKDINEMFLSRFASFVVVSTLFGSAFAEFHILSPGKDLWWGE
jgi:hypothetical protein